MTTTSFWTAECSYQQSLFVFFLFTKKYVCSRQLQDSEDELDQLGQQREKGPGFITESHGARKHRERGGRRKKKKLKLLLLTFLFPLGFIFRFFFLHPIQPAPYFLRVFPISIFQAKQNLRSFSYRLILRAATSKEDWLLLFFFFFVFSMADQRLVNCLVISNEAFHPSLFGGCPSGTKRLFVSINTNKCTMYRDRRGETRTVF